MFTSRKGGKQKIGKKIFIFLAVIMIFGLIPGGSAQAQKSTKGRDKMVIGSPALLTEMFAGFDQGQS